LVRNFNISFEYDGFWGNKWENQPVSWKYREATGYLYKAVEYKYKDAKEYNLYDAIKYWSEQQDIEELNRLEVWMQLKPSSFLILKNDYEWKQQKAAMDNYNSHLKDIIYPKFIAHFEAGRLEMWGWESRKKVKIESPEIKAYLNSCKFDFKNAEIPHVGIIGIEVYKTNVSTKQENENTRQAELKKCKRSNGKSTRNHSKKLCDIIDEIWNGTGNYPTPDDVIKYLKDDLSADGVKKYADTFTNPTQQNITYYINKIGDDTPTTKLLSRKNLNNFVNNANPLV
jgi:hypothetical protein